MTIAGAMVTAAIIGDPAQARGEVDTLIVSPARHGWTGHPVSG